MSIVAEPESVADAAEAAPKKKKSDYFTTTRSASLKSTVNPAFEMYEAFQRDFRKNIEILFPWLGIGYGVPDADAKGGIRYVGPEEAVAARNASLPSAKAVAIVERFVTCLSKNAKTLSSCYSLYYKHYKPTGAKRGESVKKIEKLLESDSFSDLAKSHPGIDWQAAKLVPKDKLWGHLKPQLTDKNREIGREVRQFVTLPCSYPEACDYCKLLWSAVLAFLQSRLEIYQYHMDGTAALKTAFDKGNTPLYAAFVQYTDAVAAMLGNSLSPREILHVIECAKGRKIAERPHLQLAIDELKKPAYALLLAAETATVKRCFATRTVAAKLKKRKAYPTKSALDKDQTMNVGSPMFSIPDTSPVSPTKHITVTVTVNGEQVEFPCKHTEYLANLTLEKVSPKKGEAYYKMGFNTNHKARTLGELKTVSIQKRGGNFYVTLPYTITHPVANFNLAWRFFQAASPKMENLVLPDQVVCASYDLGINNPVTGCLFKIGRDLQGPIKARGYGEGYILKLPTYLTSSGSQKNGSAYCQAVVALRNKLGLFHDAMKGLKIHRNTGFPMLEDEVEFLRSAPNMSEKSRQHVAKKNDLRLCVSYWMGFLNAERKRLNYELRATGYKDQVGELIRNIELDDIYYKVRSRYDSLDVSRETPRRYDTSRANRKVNANRLIASAIARDCLANGVWIVFVENLASKYAKGSANLLAKLFNASTLLDTIKAALDKIGVALVRVEKNGTSQHDPVTGALGYRDDTNHENLIVSRDGELCSIPCDKSASLCVGLVGVNHSVVPHKFYVPKPDAEAEAEEEEEEDGGSKRLTAFLADAGKTLKDLKNLTAGPGGVVRFTSDPTAKRIAGQSVYPCHATGKLYTAAAKDAIQDGIRNRCKAGEVPRPAEVIPDGAKTYKAFSTGLVLELAQPSGDQELENIVLPKKRSRSRRVRD
jgi:hypothetical protein